MEDKRSERTSEQYVELSESYAGVCQSNLEQYVCVYERRRRHYVCMCEEVRKMCVYMRGGESGVCVCEGRREPYVRM